jgi:uncharacterized phage-associated protein
MHLLRSKFKREKAIEVILYIARRISDPTFHSISKIIYFGDKTSLERYGTLLLDDIYCAMQYGPVPSNTYDLMKDAKGSHKLGFSVENKANVKPLRDANLEELSDSDIECLDAAIALYGDVPFWKRSADSEDKAWEKAWESRGDKSSNVMTIESIVALLENPDELLEHLKSQHDDSDS